MPAVKPNRLITLSLWLGCGLIFALVYGVSLASMASIWWRSDTYAHGMLVPLICLWLIHRRWRWVSQIPNTPCWWAFPLAAAGSLIWLLGKAADILVIEHLATLGILLSIVLLLQGWQRVRLMLFPFGYLLFAAPFGEELTPWLQQITANITVVALQLTGIPVYVNGLYIEIPTGRFEVAQACSGIRYLLASVAVGTLYGYLTFSSLRKRLLFALATIAMPVLANGIRAYLIVLIAYLSDMKYATGVDHLIYGWLFFGLVMAFLFWLGSFWRDADSSFNPRQRITHIHSGHSTLVMQISAPLAAIILLGSTALMAQRLDYSNAIAKPPAYNVQLSAPPLIDTQHWEPQFINPDRSFSSSFAGNDQQPVGLYMADYFSERQDKELVNAMNLFYPPPWVRARQGVITLTQPTHNIRFVELEIRHPDDSKRLIHYVYQVGWQFFERDIEAKLFQALSRLRGQPTPSRVIVFSTPFENYQDAQIRLDRFITTHWAEIIASLPAEVAAQ